MKKKIGFILVVLFFGLCFSQSQAQAATKTITYSVKTKLPASQIDGAKSYFDLKLAPGQKETLTLYLTNHSEQEIKLHIEPNTAVTNKNGVFDYSFSKTKDQLDKSLRFSFRDLVTGPKDVTLKGKETKEVSYELTLPKESFDGILLGGFYVSQTDEPGTEPTQMIVNKKAYAIAVSIKGNNKKITSKLNLNDVKPALENYRTTVTANLQNPQPELIKQMKVVAKIMKAGDTQVLHQTERDQLGMVPNSNFDFPISWDNQPLEQGEYTLDLTVTSANGDWHFSKNFTIAGKEAKQLNQTAVDLPKEDNRLLLLCGILSGIILLLVVGFIWREKQRRK
ncbi:DUF916 and DUF3324 domain-containing protein [Enterococcus asini]|uniref:DUF916 and DUF3324 domain-containing protein n=1 Tax=Enterococcus asini TaxID=57732 RepID=UPI0022E5DD88|nr:DUF916 and DUF3324 domain-containing protein [Enterococcus asini]